MVRVWVKSFLMNTMRLAILFFIVCLFGCGEPDLEKTNKDSSKDLQKQTISTSTAIKVSEEDQLGEYKVLKEDKYNPIDEFSFRISEDPTFEYIALGDRDLRSAENEFKDKKAQTQSNAGKYSDYQSDIVYNIKNYDNKNSQLHIKTLNFGKENASNEKLLIYYIGTDRHYCYIETFRGISVCSYENDIFQRYPDNLYYVDIDTAREKAISSLNNLSFDYAYAYMPLNGVDSDITFYVKDKEIVFIEMYNGLEGARWIGCKPVFEEIGKPCEFAVETAAEYHLKLPITYGAIYEEDSTNDSYLCEFDYKVPRLKETVRNAKIINEDIGINSSLEAANRLKNGDYSIVYEKHIGNDSIDYQVYQYKNLSALVVIWSSCGVDWGGWLHTKTWYFDRENGKWLSARQYAKKAGIREDEIIKTFNDEACLYKIDNVYEANFHIDKDGNIGVSEDYSD